MEINNSTLSTKNIRDNFLKLFITQVKNQDPINPINNSDFTSQLAQLAELERLEEIRKNNSEILNLFSSFLIGFKITGKDNYGNTVEGNIISITQTSDGPLFNTNKGSIHITNISKIEKN
ncbi:MAG: hypothetical protein N2446_01880 [Elusimicrobiales bacterium]|nr:hypothetical protein [Elusimicrobiales bacterium]